MKLEDLKPGRRYKLTRDVENPCLDRRERYDAAKLPWKQGDVLRAELHSDGEFWAFVPLGMQGTSRNAHGRIHRSHEGIEALLDALTELQERTRDVCARTSVDADAILDRLVDVGILTMEQITKVAEYLDAEDTAKYEAAKAAKGS